MSTSIDPRRHQPELMLYKHPQCVCQASESSSWDDLLSSDPLGNTYSPIASDAFAFEKAMSDHQAQALALDDGHFLHDLSQFSDSSTYSADVDSTDEVIATDPSAFSSSDDEATTYDAKLAMKDVCTSQLSCDSSVFDQQHALQRSSNNHNLRGYGRSLSAAILWPQQAHGVTPNPNTSNTVAVDNWDVGKSLFQGHHCRKRRRTRDDLHSIPRQRCRTACGDHEDTTLVQLLSPRTLLELRTLQSSPGLGKFHGIFAQMESSSEPQIMRNTGILAEQVDLVVRDCLRLFDARTSETTPVDSPVRCLLQLNGNPVQPMPQDPKKPFACICGCGYTSSRMIDWQRHLGLNWLKSYWQCPCCDEKFHSMRKDKLHGKGGHLETAHRRFGVKPVKATDYHHNVIDDEFRKQCGFCGVICNSFNDFTRHVGAHFKDVHASPPFDRRIWRFPWVDVEHPATTGDDDDHDDDDDDSDDSDDNDDNDHQDYDGNDTEDTRDSSEKDNGSNGDAGNSSNGANAETFPDFDHDSGHSSQQRESKHDYFGEFPTMGSDCVRMTAKSTLDESVPVSVSDYRLHQRANEFPVPELKLPKQVIAGGILRSFSMGVQYLRTKMTVVMRCLRKREFIKPQDADWPKPYLSRIDPTYGMGLAAHCVSFNGSQNFGFPCSYPEATLQGLGTDGIAHYLWRRGMNTRKGFKPVPWYSILRVSFYRWSDRDPRLDPKPHQSHSRSLFYRILSIYREFLNQQKGLDPSDIIHRLEEKWGESQNCKLFLQGDETRDPISLRHRVWMTEWDADLNSEQLEHSKICDGDCCDVTCSCTCSYGYYDPWTEERIDANRTTYSSKGGCHMIIHYREPINGVRLACSVAATDACSEPLPTGATGRLPTVIQPQARSMPFNRPPSFQALLELHAHQSAKERSYDNVCHYLRSMDGDDLPEIEPANEDCGSTGEHGPAT